MDTAPTPASIDASLRREGSNLSASSLETYRQITTPKRMPFKMRQVFNLYLSDGGTFTHGPSLPPNLLIRFCDHNINKLANAQYIGAGTDGAVFKKGNSIGAPAAPTHNRHLQSQGTLQSAFGAAAPPPPPPAPTPAAQRVIKVREIITGSDRHAALREVAIGLLMSALDAPFIAHVLDWNVWRGETNGTAPNRITSSICHQLETYHKLPGNGNIAELYELLPSDVRDRAILHWCETRVPGFRDRKDRPTAQLHKEYTDLRVAYLAERLAKSSRHQYYLTLEMPLLGSETLEHAMFSRKLPWSQRLMAPEQWPHLRAILLAIAHQLHVLQRRYRLMHGDFNLRNIVLQKCAQLPPEMCDMWVPSSTQGQWRPLTLADLGGRVPRFIDISLASCDYDRVVAPTLHLSQFEEPKSRDGVAFGVVDNVFGRSMQYDPTADMRRLGLLLAWNLIDSVERCIDNTKPPAACAALIRKQVDHRLAVVVVALNTIDQQWIELAKHPQAGTAVWARNPYMLADRHTPTFQQFTEKYRALQRHLRTIAHVLAPPPPSTTAAVAAEDAQLLATMKLMQRPTIEIVQHLIMDLNPHLDYLHRVGSRPVRTIWEDHPLLPCNVPRWLPE